jgi:hypothetical protein
MWDFFGFGGKTFDEIVAICVSLYFGRGWGYGISVTGGEGRSKEVH